MYDIAIITSSKIELSTIKNQHNVIICVESGGKYFKNAPERCEVCHEYLMGDFDSISKNQLKLLAKEGVEIIQLHDERNLSDTESAIKFAIEKYGRNSKITVYAQNGGRLDHQYTFFNMLRKYHNIALIDDFNYIVSYPAGEYYISNLKEYQYVSFFALEDCHDFELSGFLYDVGGIDLIEEANICLSNQFIGSVGRMAFVEGRAMVLYSRDKKRK